jgi:hypothetical protein
MIFRLSQSLISKIKEGHLPTAALDKNPYADWSARLFRADRTQYILLSNTASLYSVVMFGRGISYDGQFINHAVDCLRECMTHDGLGLIYTNFIVPAMGTIRFCKPLNRSVTGSMNELELIAKRLLKTGEWAPFDLGAKLNETLLAALGGKETHGYATPREAFKQLGHVDAQQLAEPADRSGSTGRPSLDSLTSSSSDSSSLDDELYELLDEVPSYCVSRFVALVSLTDAFCDEHLNAECRELCREMAVAVCQEGAPVIKGKAEGWAAGIVYALGQVNFLMDSTREPHMKGEEIAGAFGISVSTIKAKARIISDNLQLMPLHPKWTLPSRMDDNPLVWMREVNGFVMDIRHASREAQEVAYEEGLIPYIPADREGDGGVSAETHAAPVSGTGERSQLYELEVALRSGPVTEAFAKKNPSIIRTIQIRSDQTLEDLHHAIFKAFDRFEEHMYEFQVGGKRMMDRKARRYVLPMAMDEAYDDQTPAGDLTRTTIGELNLKVDEPFAYWFDFGDDWWHQVTVVAIHEEVPRGRYPKVTQKTGDSPPQYVDWDEDEDEDENEDD